MREITSADLENLVARPMAETGKSPGRIRYALTVVSVVWHMAAERGLASGEIRSGPSKSRAWLTSGIAF